MCKKIANFKLHFFRSFKRAIAHFQNGDCPILLVGQFALSKICIFFSHFHTLALFKSVVVQSHFFVAHLKSVIVPSHFFCNFQSATKCAIALLKRANRQKSAKNVHISKLHFLHFKKSDCTFSQCGITQPCSW